MIEVNVFALENGDEYYEVDNIFYNNNNYLMLSKVLDNTDICVRRIINSNGNFQLLAVSEDEKLSVMELFVEKNRNLVLN